MGLVLAAESHPRLTSFRNREANMNTYDVRIERVEVTTERVQASSALLARHDVMNALENGDLEIAEDRWKRDGINVEGAVEVAV